MRKSALRLICAAAALALLSMGAYALSSGDALISLRYLRDTFIPQAVQQGEEAAGRKLQEAYDAAKGQLEAAQPGPSGPSASGLSGSGLAPRDWGQGDVLRLPTGSGLLLLEGAVSVDHGGAVVDITEGTELSSGARLTAGHRYLVGENTQAAFTVLSGAARMGVEGSCTYSAASSGFPPFYDVNSGDWYRDAVAYVCQAGLFSGMDEHHFSPRSAMDRSMLMAVLYRMAGSPEDELRAAQITYTDVPASAWYAPYVRWGGAQGITAGTGPNTFGPTQQLTRQQVVALLYSFACGYLDRPQTQRADLSGYRDLDQVSPWAREAFAWAVAEGIVSSSSSDALTLSPQNSASRAEMAVMLRAFAERIL